MDSLCASLGQGLLVWYAARMKNEGRGIGEVRDWLEENKLHLCHWFTVDDLHFLKRGGRISSATAVLGTMLSIKPVMHVDDEGHLTKVGTAGAAMHPSRPWWTIWRRPPSTRRARPFSSATATARGTPTGWPRT